MSKKPVEATTFFATMVEWDVSEREAIDKKLRFRGAMMIVEGVIIAGLVLAVIPLTTLKEFITIPVVVDKQTGNYEVRDGKERINVSDKYEQRMIADIAIHVKAREGFTRGESEQNYRTVFNQLPEDERGKWRHDYVDKPTALLNTLGARDQIRVANPSIQWLPTNPETPKLRSAQFRFDKERRLAGRPATTQPFIATLTFTYDQGAVPNTVEDLATNPFGFQVLNYRADPAGPERELRTDDARSAQ